MCTCTHAHTLVSCMQVLHLESCKREWIGPLEQPFLEVACLAGDVRPDSTTHCELDPTNMLSLIARYVYVFTQHAYSATMRGDCVNIVSHELL
jgi:hypothetical protein